MNAKQFKQHFENCLKNLTFDYNKLDDIINEWKKFREKIINKTITVEEYNCKNEYFENDEYCLRYLCETVASDGFFGKLGTMPSYRVGLWKTDEGDSDSRIVYYKASKNASERVPLTEDEIKEKLDITRDFLYRLVTAYKWNDLISLLDSHQVFKDIQSTNFIFEIVFLNSLLSKEDLIENKDKDDKVEIEYYLQLIQIYKYEKYENLKFLSQCKKNSHTNSKILPFVKSKKAFELCKKALDLENIDHKTIYILNWALWYATEGIPLSKLLVKIFSYIREGYKQIILTGAPGTGKTFTAQNVAQYFPYSVKQSEGINESGDKIDIKYKFVQFHPSFDYSDFVEGLRPVQLKGDQNTTFVRFDGIFKKFCRFVVEENNKFKNEELDNKELATERYYFFIIDEINRADLSKVFGELMYSLEYRGETGRVQTQYANLNTYYYDENNEIKCYDKDNDVFFNGFYIPKNIYIIGTMNDIDRSVDSFDFALRRRFKWYEVKANDVMEDVLKNFVKKEEYLKEIIEIMNKLNNAIFNEEEENEMGLSEAYHIGPAYLKSLKGVKGKPYEKLQDIYQHEIESIIYEYVRGRDSLQIKTFLKKCREAFGLDENYRFKKKPAKNENNNNVNEATNDKSNN